MSGTIHCHECGKDMPYVVGQPAGVPIYCSERCYQDHKEKVVAAVSRMRKALELSESAFSDMFVQDSMVPLTEAENGEASPRPPEVSAESGRRKGGTAGPLAPDDDRWDWQVSADGHFLVEWDWQAAPAQLLVHHLGEMTERGRKAIAKWLRDQAHAVESGGNYDDVYRARYLK